MVHVTAEDVQIHPLGELQVEMFAYSHYCARRSTYLPVRLCTAGKSISQRRHHHHQHLD